MAKPLGVVDVICIVSQAAGLLFALGIGLSPLRRDWLTSCAVAAGLLVNLPGCLTEGGPGSFAGLILLPIVFILAAHLGRGVRWVLLRIGTLKARRDGGRVVE